MCLSFFNQGEVMNAFFSLPHFSSSRLFCATAALALSALCSGAFAQALDKDTLADIQRHRAMAAAHEMAAKCLEAGKKDEVCEKELQVACKGLAIGKYCGMKHEH
jgi:hypothetical protein